MRADRLLSLILLLQTRGKLTAQALAQELGVSRRTILRDVEALSFSGIPVYCEGGHGGGIALDEQYRTTLTGLNALEVQSLFVNHNTAVLHEVGLGDSAERLALKLLAALPTAHQSTVSHIRQRLLIDPTWWWHETQASTFWAELQRAVYDDWLITVIYEHYDGEIVERTLEPYSLVNKSGAWYLVARRAAEFRTYRVNRLHQVQVLNQSFNRHTDFDLARYWQDHLQDFIDSFSAYHCTLRIHPERLAFVSWLLPGRWQRLEATHSTGWITVRLQMDSPLMAKMLVFGLGPLAEVLDPPELLAMVRSEARLLLNYLA